MPKGIDISEFNGNFDIWGYQPDFVIIRAGDGNYWDEKLDRNVNICIEKNIPYGLYWLIRDWSIADAESTAADLCKYANSRSTKPSVGIWCDVEDEYDDNPKNAIPYVDAFCRTVEDCGYYAGIYCNYWYHDHLFPALEKFDCWIADWDEDPHSDPGVGTMKQYSTSDGELDLDVCFVPLSIYKVTPEPVRTLEERVAILEEEVKKLKNSLK